MPDLRIIERPDGRTEVRAVSIYGEQFLADLPSRFGDDDKVINVSKPELVEILHRAHEQDISIHDPFRP